MYLVLNSGLMVWIMENDIWYSLQLIKWKKNTIAQLAFSKGSHKKLDTEISDLEHLG